MCGKLPTGSLALLPSGSAPAASGSGVPHHGGSISTARAEPAKQSSSANNAAAPTSPLRRPPTMDFPHSPVARNGSDATGPERQPRQRANYTTAVRPRQGDASVDDRAELADSQRQA